MVSPRLALAGAAFALSLQPACAHDAFGTAGTFWFGALHFGASALTIATVVGLGAALRAAEKRVVFPALLIAGAAAAAAGLSGKVFAAYAAVGAVAAGLAAAADMRLNTATAVALALIAGAGAGIAAEIDVPSAAASAGAAFAVFLLVGLSYAVFERAEHVLPVARRVIGAWVAAIGLLIAALTWLG